MFKNKIFVWFVVCTVSLCEQRQLAKAMANMIRMEILKGLHAKLGLYYNVFLIVLW